MGFPVQDIVQAKKRAELQKKSEIYLLVPKSLQGWAN